MNLRVLLLSCIVVMYSTSIISMRKEQAPSFKILADRLVQVKNVWQKPPSHLMMLQWYMGHRSYQGSLQQSTTLHTANHGQCAQCALILLKQLNEIVKEPAIIKRIMENAFDVKASDPKAFASITLTKLTLAPNKYMQFKYRILKGLRQAWDEVGTFINPCHREDIKEHNGITTITRYYYRGHTTTQLPTVQYNQERLLRDSDEKVPYYYLEAAVNAHENLPEDVLCNQVPTLTHSEELCKPSLVLQELNVDKIALYKKVRIASTNMLRFMGNAKKKRIINSYKHHGFCMKNFCNDHCSKQHACDPWSCNIKCCSQHSARCNKKSRLKEINSWHWYFYRLNINVGACEVPTSWFCLSLKRPADERSRYEIWNNSIYECNFVENFLVGPTEYGTVRVIPFMGTAREKGIAKYSQSYTLKLDVKPAVSYQAVHDALAAKVVKGNTCL